MAYKHDAIEIADPVDSTRRAEVTADGKLSVDAGVTLDGATVNLDGATIVDGSNASQKLAVSAAGEALVALAPALNKSSNAYEASNIIKASAGKLFKLRVYNSGADQFIQLHDSATVPANTAVPKTVEKVLAGTSREFDFGIRGMPFANGIVVCNSSTGPTKTIGSGDCYFNAQYA